MTEGQRNNNCYILASSFNDFGVNKSLAGYVVQNYRTSDFSEREINQTIDSAYAQTQNFGTKYYEDEERVNNIRVKLRRGASKSEVRKQLEDSDIENVVIESVLNRVEEENQQKQFWTKI